MPTAPFIRIANRSSNRFYGWRRLTVDRPFKGAVKMQDGTIVVAGGLVGHGDLRAVDVLADLEPGEMLELHPNDPAEATPIEWATMPLPQNPLEFFGDVPRILGHAMGLVSCEVDGAGYSAHLRTRLGSMVCVDVWVSWYPDQPYAATGEIVVCASNPSSPDMGATIPAITLEWGDAEVQAIGGNPTLISSQYLADGQARTMPFVMLWPRHAQQHVEAESMRAVASGGIVANGLSDLYPSGTPRLSSRVDVHSWTRQNMTAALDRLRGNLAGPLGVSARSGDSGAQEDQVFVGAECSMLGAEMPRYLTACRQSMRPCHHLEADGNPLDLSKHPSLVFWDGRPHWHWGVSPDRLGKPRNLNEWESGGWWGPDVEHAFINTLTLAYRVTGSPALQWQLECMSNVYLAQWTVARGLSTSATFAARAIGWEGILVWHLWHHLKDRARAEAVKQRWVQRAEQILVPQLRARGNIWDIRRDDPRLGSGDWWIPWQQSVGSYGMYLAAHAFGQVEAMIVAIAGAKRVLDDAWRQDASGQWLPLPQMAVDGRGTPDASFSLYGMPLAVAVIKMEDSRNVRARDLWAHLVTLSGGGSPWFPPEVQA